MIRESIAVTIGILVVLPLAAAVPPFPCAEPVPGTQACAPIIPPTEIAAGESATYADGEFLVAGTIFVQDGGELLVSNASLLFLPSSGGIVVEPGGRAQIVLSALALSPLGAPAEAYAIVAEPTGELILHLSAVDSASAIVVRSDDVVIEDNTFTSLERGIEVDQASTRISRNGFVTMPKGIGVQTGDVTVDNNTFLDVGMLVEATNADVAFADNVADHPQVGILAVQSTLAMHRNIMDEDGYPPTRGVDATLSTGAIAQNTFRDWGIAIELTDSDFLVEDNVIETSGAGVAATNFAAGGQVRVLDNVFTDVQSPIIVGWAFGSGGHTEIRGNDIAGASTPISIFGGNASVVDNILAASGGSTIQTDGAVELVGNALGGAVHVFASDVEAASNVMIGAVDAPIELMVQGGGLPGALIHNNTLAHAALLVSSAPNARIADNEVTLGLVHLTESSNATVDRVTSLGGRVAPQVAITNSADVRARNLTLDASRCVGLLVSQSARIDVQDIDVTGSGNDLGGCQGLPAAGVLGAFSNNLTLSRATVTGTVGGHAVYHFFTRDVLMRDSAIHANAFDGVVVENSLDVAIHGSSLHTNGLNGYAGRALWNKDAPHTVDASGNWWGDASGPEHPSNLGGAGDLVAGNVAISPWLTSPP
jgi:hypothetical protein